MLIFHFKKLNTDYHINNSVFLRFPRRNIIYLYLNYKYLKIKKIIQNKMDSY